MSCPSGPRILGSLVLVGLVLGLAPLPAARAQVIIRPTFYQTSMGTTNAPGSKVVDQVNMSAAYVSGVTSFLPYATTTTVSQATIGNSGWYSDTNLTTGTFDFSLGGTFTISDFALWTESAGFSQYGVAGFTLFASPDATFSSLTNLGSFNATPGLGPSSAIPSQVFSFAPTSASYVRMQITSNGGDSVATGFEEAAFGTAVASVPEPSTWLLTGLVGGIGGLGRWWRRSRRPV